ncbi:MAG: hypothetical protein RRY19_09695 [Clostridium sp.]
MTTINKIGFFGRDTEDIIIYFANLFKKLDKTVSILDLTGNLIYYFETDGQEIVTIDDVDIIFNEDHIEEETDLIFINFGYDEDFKAELFETDLNFMVTDIQKKHIMKLRQMLDKQEVTKDYIKVFRDIVDTKVTKEYLDTLLGSSHNTAEEYIFYLNNNELVNKIKLQYYGEVDFKNLPKEFKQMLRDIVGRVEFEEDPKALARKLKRIERGKGV